jgi:preprotein translocase subunit SecA
MGDELIDHLIKVMMLQAIDTHWKDHLLNIDHLKEGIGLRGYGQTSEGGVMREYKKEAYNCFMEMIIRIREEVVERIYWVQVEHPDEVEEMEVEQQQRSKKLVFNLSSDEERVQEPAKSQKVAGRNDACPCGSGKKYKKCCGK